MPTDVKIVKESVSNHTRPSRSMCLRRPQKGRESRGCAAWDTADDAALGAVAREEGDAKPASAAEERRKRNSSSATRSRRPPISHHAA
jgi:hypothetical protein